MKNLSIVFLFIVFSLATSQAQFNQWAWMNGNSTANPAAVYGVKGVPAAANNPGGRYEACEWTDLQGNFWLFGGAMPGGSNRYGDLWKYDPATNMWTWVHGSNTSSGNWGTKGVAAPTNEPSSRCVGLSWVDLSGDLWMYGGQSAPDDLWKYNIASNQWTWMAGSNTSQVPVYGTKGVPAATNTPGDRQETSCSWTDNNGDLWLFGSIGSLNDLWKYSMASNQWTWMSGNNTSGQGGVYGTQGVAAAANTPGARWCFTSWKDLSGNLWLFGGYGYVTTGGTPGNLNDLWKYDVATNEWTWVGGANTINPVGNYGTQCTFAASNWPGGRMENRTRWTDDCGNFWIFGGRVFSSFPSHNDLWRYNPNPGTPNFGQWVWVSGSNVLSQASVYGTQGVPAPTNIIGERNGSIPWRNNDGLWIFGGIVAPSSINFMNELWKYIPDKPTATFTYSLASGSNCSSVATFTNNSVSNCNEIKSYDWNFDDPSSGSNNTSTFINPFHTYTVAGTYTVMLVVTSCTGNKDSSIQSLAIPTAGLVLTASSGTGICEGSSVTLTAGGANLYTWSPSSGLSATTGSSVTAGPSANTIYQVIGSGGGCSDTLLVSITVDTIPIAKISGDTIICLGETTALSAGNASGYSWSTNASTQVISVSPGTNTTYSVQVMNGACNNSANVSVVVNGVVVDAGANVSLVLGNSVTLTASGSGIYLWTPAAGLSCLTCPNPLATPQITTIYYVTVTDANGCTDLDSVIVTVEILCGDIFIPTAFSPNNDGQNDLFQIQGNCIKEMQFTIYNRWGEIVFETNDSNEAWNGIYRGKPMDAGVFAYQLTLTLMNKETITKKGNISLIR